MSEHGLLEYKRGLYELTTGEPITSLLPFSSPLDEYRSAFEDPTQEFLDYYTFKEGISQKRSLSRGEFWDLACSTALYLSNQGLGKGERIIHCFSGNNIYDLVFRLAAVLVGCVPVTINWQADDDERILYKAKVTEAKAAVYDRGFATRVEAMKPKLPAISFLEAERFEGYQSTSQLTFPQLSYEDERIVVFTAGTTARPKGVSLSHRSYLANRLTFEQYFGLKNTTRLDLLLVNPLHHANSTALSDWGIRRKGTIIHLLERYTTDYWKILVEVADHKRDLLVTSLVARHIDFLEDFSAESKLPIEEAKIKEALSKTDILIGSAPVGPKTIKRIRKFSSHLPHVRFGSTETCLQVMAVPTMPEDDLMKTFEAGWSHRYRGEERIGYYIGREHFPFTRVKVVKSIDPESKEYLRPCEIGEPGYLITQGPNIMSHYVGEPEATKAVFREGWYTGLRDIVFTLPNQKDGQLDYYWMSRDSELLVRGGAKYAYDQVAEELSKFVVEQFQLKPEQFELAVIGLRLESEHEDSCCVTVELNQEASKVESKLKSDFLKKAARVVSKGNRPNYLRFAPIPRNFKGAVLYPQLKQEFLEAIRQNKAYMLQSKP